MTGFIVLALYVAAFFVAYLAVSALYRAFLRGPISLR